MSIWVRGIATVSMPAMLSGRSDAPRILSPIDLPFSPPLRIVSSSNPSRGITRDSLPPGTEIVVEGYRAKGNPFRANGRDLTFADGRKLFMGSSGVGAPPDLGGK